ncbi:MAG: GTPase domain-containing protein, partial [Gemmataceae bacterium]
MNDATPTAGDDDLRIVLFGLPEAGKSSLLGALGQAALAQEHLLGGRVIDEGGGLAALAKTLYDEHGRRTAGEVVPYPVRYETVEGAALDAVILDCDGRVANDMLVQKLVPDGTAAKGTLAAEVAEADALLLVIDAAATAEQMEADFGEFDRFLKAVEGARGERTEVAGLPVFLVLTKCDLLAHAADSTADWMDRIEQRKRDVDGRFRDFLSRRQGDGGEAGPVLAFGRIDLHLWATAVKRPGLLGALARPREPFGVAELFRQALTEAAGHRRRAERSSRRLAWLVGVAAGLLLTMVSLTVAFLVINHATAASALAARVDDVR